MRKFLIFSIAMILVIACGKDPNCYKNYSIDFPLETSLQETFNVGDTIWYQMRLPNQLLDRNSGDFVDFSNFDLFFNLDFCKMDTTDYANATHLFNVCIDSGNVQATHTGLNVFFQSTSQKIFRIGFIPKARGLFFSSFNLDFSFYIGQYFDFKCWFGPSYSTHPGLQITQTPCIEQMYEGTTITVNADSVNFHLVNGICQNGFGYTNCYKSYNNFKRGAFAFRVK